MLRPNNPPVVSVVLITYNRADLLPHAIDSVLQQTYCDFELIVIDDGSTDNTAEVVGQYIDPRVIYHPVENGERARARNIGIQLSRGSYISFLDSDDWYLPNKLAAQVAVLENHPEVGMTLGGWRIVKDNGELIDEIRPWETLSSDVTVDDMLFRGTATPNTGLFRRVWFDRVEGFDNDLIISEDTDMWIRLLLAGCKNVWTEELVAVVLAHSSNSLRNWTAVKNSRMNLLAKSFARKEFVANIRMSKEEVYARFHLALAWQAYSLGYANEGKQELIEAVASYPVLVENNADSIFKSMLDYSQYFLVNDPDRFLQFAFEQLPPEVHPLAARRKELIAKNAMGQAWKAKRDGNFGVMRKYTLRAISLEPGCLKDRGIQSMLLQSFLGDRLWRIVHPEKQPA